MKSLKSLRVGDSSSSETDKLASRQVILRDLLGLDLPNLFSRASLPDSVGQKNCENWVGSVSLPVGVAGPILLDKREYYVPLATTEGALVASVSRGCKAIFESAGASVFVEKKGMTRAPVFECKDSAGAYDFVDFLAKNEQLIKKTAEGTSNHLEYWGHQAWVRGRYVYVRFVFDTDEAMGMNMVTIATAKISEFVTSQARGVKLLALSSNACTDKKDNFINTVFGRGYSAQAEVILPESVVRQVFKSDFESMVKVHIQKNLIGSNVGGSLSQNAQVANVLAGIFLATGQDPAHVVEGSKAFLSLEKVEGGLYASLTLPNLNIGSVGGGTYLPAQKESRMLIGGGGEISVMELVKVTAAACLAGELSLLAALSENKLAKAHQNLGRSKDDN